MKREPDFSQRNDNLLSLHISVQAAWSIFAAAVIGTSTATWQLFEIKESIASDRWKRSHAREYAHQMQAMNPALRVPDVDEIARKLGE